MSAAEAIAAKLDGKYVMRDEPPPYGKDCNMNLESFNDKCVRIVTASGEVFEGVATYDDKEYAFHEYGRNQEALRITPIVFYKDEILSVVGLEDVNGPFGHYAEKYGLLEKKCLEWGTDMIEEVFDSEDDIQILRMLACINDNFQSFADRAVPGMAPWRSGNSILETEEDEDKLGPDKESTLDVSLQKCKGGFESGCKLKATPGKRQSRTPQAPRSGEAP